MSFSTPKSGEGNESCHFYYHVILSGVEGGMVRCVIVFVLFVSLFLSKGFTQDLSGIGSSHPLKITGSISANSSFYAANGIASRQDPLVWMLHANLNFSLYGWSVPFSVSFSQQQTNFTQPFNQYGLSPSYKWIALHMGYRSLSFSDYTLAGNLFLGGGFEVAPPQTKLKITGLYGRFSRAVQERDTLGKIIGIPAYERWGYGGKIYYGERLRNIEVMFFKARDDPYSLQQSPETLGIEAPGENLVIGVNANNQFNQHLSLKINYAFSAYNTDLRSSAVELQSHRLFYLGGLFTPNASAQFNKAIAGALHYKANHYTLKLAYRRIDPEYRTMGAPFINNDLEDLASTVAFKLFKNKLHLSATGGLQRNNLDKILIGTSVRVISALNGSCLLNEKLTLTGTLSNYNTSTHMQQLDQFDSLAYYQVTRNKSIGLHFNTGNQHIKHSATANITHQTANDLQNMASDFYTIIMGYALSLPQQKTVLNTALSTIISEVAGTRTMAIGPTVSASKRSVNKKWRYSLGLSYLNNKQNGAVTHKVYNGRTALAYKISQRQQANMGVNIIKRAAVNTTQPSFTEFRIQLGYRYSFV